MFQELVQDIDITSTPQQEGLIDTVKDFFNPTKLVEKLDLTKPKMIAMGIYFCIGLALGFLMKKYANFLIAAAITVGCVVLLHYVGFLDVAVHTDRIQALFGIQLPSVQGDLTYHIWDWVKKNVAVVVCFVVGFLIGMKVA
jgi:hypothetical protein